MDPDSHSNYHLGCAVTEALTDRLALGQGGSHFGIPLRPAADGVNRTFVLKGLFEKIEGTLMHRLDCHGNIAMAGDENYRYSGAADTPLQP